MKVLVTGGAGFLGHHVARRFLESSHDVIIFDQVSAADPDVKTIVGDLTDPEAVDRAVAGRDVVVHIGAIGDVYLAGDRPALAAQVNVTGTAHVADAAARNDSKVVYASTWEVYGHPVYQPLDEDHPCNPDHPYNITKLAGERLVMSSAALRDVPAVALRLGTAYGRGLRPNSVFRIFIDRARRGEPLTIQGDGSQGRQFTHASDIARAFLLAAEANFTGEVFNVVAEESVSIRQLAEMVAARIPTSVTYGDPRPGDVPPAMVSSEKAKAGLHWQAEKAFRDGLDELIEERT